MPKVTVMMPVWAEYVVEVEVSDEDLANGDFDAALDDAYNKLHGLCAQCTGGKYMYKDASLCLESSDAEARYITDENGETVWGDPDKPLGW